MKQVTIVTSWICSVALHAHVGVVSEIGSYMEYQGLGLLSQKKLSFEKMTLICIIILTNLKGQMSVVFPLGLKKCYNLPARRVSVSIQ